MAISYEPVISSLIPNTIMRKRLRDGVHVTYGIKAVDGYVLHDKDGDVPHPDTNELMRAYTTNEVTCRADYDFTQTTEIDGYTAYGQNEFFARPNVKE